MKTPPVLATEAAAREELSGTFGRPLSDTEWQEARTNLLTVFGVLVEWHEAENDVRAERKTGTARR